jgi:hypothetical protein
VADTARVTAAPMPELAPVITHIWCSGLAIVSPLYL